MRWLKQLLGADRQPTDTLRPLWDRVIDLARAPEWYRRGGVADSMAGRFDMVSLITAIVLLRLENQPDQPAAAARLTEQFLADMEGQLRQQGIGDPALGKRVGALVSTLGGRIGALRTALAQAEDGALLDLLERNVTFADAADPAFVAQRLRGLAAQLAGLTYPDLSAGRIAA